MTPEDFARVEATTRIIRMRKLCKKMGDDRHILANPIRTGGFIYCCNGYVAARAPAEQWPDFTEDTKDAPNFKEVWAGVEVVERWCSVDLALLQIPDLPACSHCGGSGQLECAACTNCKECGDCDGTGKESEDQHRFPVILGTNVISGRNLKRILDAFPDAVFCANDRGMKGVPWKAEGVVTGMLMPVRVKEDAPNPPNVTAPELHITPGTIVL